MSLTVNTQVFSFPSAIQLWYSKYLLRWHDPKRKKKLTIHAPQCLSTCQDHSRKLTIIVPICLFASLCLHPPVCLWMFPCLSTEFPLYHWTIEWSRKLTIILLIPSLGLTGSRKKSVAIYPKISCPCILRECNTHWYAGFTVRNVLLVEVESIFCVKVCSWWIPCANICICLVFNAFLKVFCVIAASHCYHF